jgi:AcrR family transcriptional regulator
MSTETTGSRRRRPYRKQRRAEQEERTRERIAAATAALHGSVGPAQATVSAIAERAGVQRATVYRHFPTNEALYEACTAHFYGRHPLPDPTPWSEIADPTDRLRRALGDLYQWFEETEDMLANVTRDAAYTPPGPRERFRAYFEHVRATLMEGRRQRGRARERIAAGIGHAISFPTWRSLVREQGLASREAVKMMVCAVEHAGAAR